MGKMKVVYEGPYSARELAAVDLKKAGVEEFTKTMFLKGKAVEVEEEVGKALIENKLFGNFRAARTKNKTEDVNELEDDSKPEKVADATGPSVSTKTTTK